MARPTQRLAACGIELPPPVAPEATYVPLVRCGALVFVSGRDPVWAADIRYAGILGRDFNLAEAQDAVLLATLNAFAHLDQELDLDRVLPVALRAHVRVQPEARDLHRAADSAMSLLSDVFGRAPALTVLGASGLAAGIAAEVETVFEMI